MKSQQKTKKKTIQLRQSSRMLAKRKWSSKDQKFRGLIQDTQLPANWEFQKKTKAAIGKNLDEM